MSPGVIAAMIRDAAIRHGVDPFIAAAVVGTESVGDPWAYRFEEEWFERHMRTATREQLAGYVPPRGQLPTLFDEKIFRATSFGLMQVMGDRARCEGFTGRWLTQLCDPALNLEIGCAFLARLHAKTGDYRKALLRYNGGRDPQYPDKVFAAVTRTAT